MKPSCAATGRPMERMSFIVAFRGQKSLFDSLMLLRFKMTQRASKTLTTCESVVPSAAPAGPRRSAPMKKKSSPMFTTQAAAMKYMGLRESPIPRKIDASTL